MRFKLLGLALLLVGLGLVGSGLASATQAQPSGMVLIPTGEFLMGDTFKEGGDDEWPLHTVSVSAFYMDKYEVTKKLWDEVASWAAEHGYDIWSGSVAAKGANHPVIYVTWYQAVKWANARSEKEGLTPCYYTDSTQATVYRTGMVDVPIDRRSEVDFVWVSVADGGRVGEGGARRLCGASFPVV